MKYEPRLDGEINNNNNNNPKYFHLFKDSKAESLVNLNTTAFKYFISMCGQKCWNVDIFCGKRFPFMEQL